MKSVIFAMLLTLVVAIVVVGILIRQSGGRGDKYHSDEEIKGLLKKTAQGIDEYASEFSSLPITLEDINGLSASKSVNYIQLRYDKYVLCALFTASSNTNGKQLVNSEVSEISATAGTPLDAHYWLVSNNDFDQLPHLKGDNCYVVQVQGAENWLPHPKS